MTRESRRAGHSAAESLEARGNSNPILPSTATMPRVSGPQLGAGVLVVRVEPRSDGREVELATADAEPGRQVRLVVANVYPPLWVRDRVRPDLRVQVEASDERVLLAWLDALGGAIA